MSNNTGLKPFRAVAFNPEFVKHAMNNRLLPDTEEGLRRLFTITNEVLDLITAWNTKAREMEAKRIYNGNCLGWLYGGDSLEYGVENLSDLLRHPKAMCTSNPRDPQDDNPEPARLICDAFQEMGVEPSHAHAFGVNGSDMREMSRLLQDVVGSNDTGLKFDATQEERQEAVKLAPEEIQERKKDAEIILQAIEAMRKEWAGLRYKIFCEGASWAMRDGVTSAEIWLKNLIETGGEPTGTLPSSSQ
jgi:hypothetical protein